MQTEKAKKKNSPRRHRLLRVGIILIVCLVCGVFLFPYAETALIKWLEDDPFTPMCHDEDLEIAFTTDAFGEDHIYRMRLNGESPQRMSDSSDPHATMLEWTPDGKYLLFFMPNVLPNQLNFVSADTGHIESVAIDSTYPFWYFIPDNSAVIVQTQYYNDSPKYQIDLPIGDSSIAESIPEIPLLFSLPENRTLSSMYNDFNRAYNDTVTSWDGSFVVNSRQTVQRVGVNLQKRIFVEDLSSYQVLWEIGEERTDYDVEYVIQDLSQSNDLLYFRRYYPIGESNVTSDMPDEVFIAHIDDKRIEPILEDRPINAINQLVWSPDNQWMLISLYNWDTKTADTYIADYDGRQQSFVTSVAIDSFTFGAYKWTPDGEYLSYTNSNNWIYLLNLESHEKCRVAKGRSEWSTEYDWRLVDD